MCGTTTANPYHSDKRDTMTDFRCDTGSCPRVETDGDITRIWDTDRPDVRVECSTESWQQLLQTVRDTERARLAAELGLAVRLIADVFPKEREAALEAQLEAHLRAIAAESKATP
jgi:hypothetical protein